MQHAVPSAQKRLHEPDVVSPPSGTRDQQPHRSSSHIIDDEMATGSRNPPNRIKNESVEGGGVDIQLDRGIEDGRT